MTLPFPLLGADPHPFDPWDEPRPTDRRPLDRITHLVLLDGRLVDVWSEPVEAGPWQRHADELDLRRRPCRPAPASEPPYDAALAWLSDVAGGVGALAALDDAPLVPGGLALPDAAPADRQRLEATATLLARVADELFDAEAAIALRRALLLVWAASPDAVRRARSAAALAGGICWAVGKANDLFTRRGITQTAVQHRLGLSSSMSSLGAGVQRELRGFALFTGFRPHGLPDLLPLGHPELLTSSTRRLLVAIRDRAEEARAAAEPTG
ncbi:hypothetical protein ACFP3Q_06760 [Nocardioides sp. GCM10027113]|uniref:hypothetical protein n=1 Tax=unclassified Nocardioides TaxID=2615069 RepID=UPI003607FD52